MNIDSLIQEKIKSMNFDKIFTDALEKQIEETIKKVLKDELGSYSTFSKALEAAVEKSMKFNPDRISLPEYSNFVVDQAGTVIRGLMDEAAAARIQKALTEKIAPNITKEIEFEDLRDSIEDVILSYFKEEDSCCDDTAYIVSCEKEEKTYGSGHYWKFSIKKDTDRIAELFLSDGKAYYACGEERHPFTKRFQAYKFMGTMVSGLYEYTRTLKREDTY